MNPNSNNRTSFASEPFAPIVFAAPEVSANYDVVVTRGSLVESRHRVHVAVVDDHGGIRIGARDPHVVTWWRSCAKPFQVMTMIADGHFDALGWGDDELALACASHGGEPEHVALAGTMLARIGLEEGDLACGPHEPLAARGALVLRESGHPVTRLHNNCSGKHAAMLAHAVSAQWSISGYERHTHPTQTAAAATVSAWSGTASDRLALGVDGCGVTVFGLPLSHMALAYARLGAAAARGDAVPARIVGAMTGHPFLVGGTERFDTLLMEACNGRVLCKIGAEGVHTLSIIPRGIGIAIKVEDGSPRAQFPAVLGVLAALGELPPTLPVTLSDLLGKSVRNTRGEEVGKIQLENV